MAIISLQSLCKDFHDTLVIKDINLKIPDGEFTVFIGPSGCGKSTLLRLISGLESATSGDILFNNHKVTHLPPNKRNLSMVFQDYALYPHMNISENISFGLLIAKLPKNIISQKVSQVALMLGLEELLARKPAELSGGQRQRVAMARALIRDTNLLLMDEPLSNLDAKLRTHMRSELTHLKQKIQRNIIYVTHDQVEAMTLADRIVVLNQGKIQQYDTPENLYSTPANRFVAEFLGTPKMNILKTEIQNQSDHIYLKADNFQIKLTPKQKTKLGNYNQDHILVGVRPHDFNILDKENNDTYFKCSKKYNEYIGAHNIITADCGQQNIQFETPNKIYQNSEFSLSCSLDKIHLFDSYTEKRIVL